MLERHISWFNTQKLREKLYPINSEQDDSQLL